MTLHAWWTVLLPPSAHLQLQTITLSDMVSAHDPLKSCVRNADAQEESLCCLSCPWSFDG